MMVSSFHIVLRDGREVCEPQFECDADKAAWEARGKALQFGAGRTRSEPLPCGRVCSITVMRLPEAMGIMALDLATEPPEVASAPKVGLRPDVMVPCRGPPA